MKCGDSLDMLLAVNSRHTFSSAAAVLVLGYQVKDRTVMNLAS